MAFHKNAALADLSREKGRPVRGVRTGGEKTADTPAYPPCTHANPALPRERLSTGQRGRDTAQASCVLWFKP